MWWLKMKNNNVFRFVSIRAPERKKVRKISPEPARDPNDSTGTISSGMETLFFQLVAEHTATGSSLEEALLAVGKDFIASRDYVIKNRNWNSFLPSEGALESLVQDIKSSGNITDLEPEMEKIFQTNIGQEFTFDSFLPNQKFHEMYRSLWFSYYSNVILREQRPGDRPVLIFWIKIFHMIRNLSSTKVLNDLIAGFEGFHPALPGYLVIVNKTSKRVSSPDDSSPFILETDEERLNKLKDTRLRLESLKAARNFINDLYQRKKK